MPGNSAIFDPSPELAESILALVGSPDLSFHDIAARAETTPQALAAWLALPQIQERTASVHSAAASHIRLAATSNLHVSIASLVKLLHAYNRGQLSTPFANSSTDGDSSVPPSPRSPGSDGRVFEAGEGRSPSVNTPTAQSGDSPDNLRARHLRLREHEIARRASYLLYRLARFFPATAPPARLSEPSAAPTNTEAPAAPAVAHTPNPGAVPLGLHPPTSAPPTNEATPHADTAPSRTAAANDRPTAPPSDLDIALTLENLTAFLENFAAQAGIDTSDLDPNRATATALSLPLPGRRAEVAESSRPVTGVHPPPTQAPRTRTQPSHSQSSPARELVGAAGAPLASADSS